MEKPVFPDLISIPFDHWRVSRRSTGSVKPVTDSISAISDAEAPSRCSSLLAGRTFRRSTRLIAHSDRFYLGFHVPKNFARAASISGFASPAAASRSADTTIERDPCALVDDMRGFFMRGEAKVGISTSRWITTRGGLVCREKATRAYVPRQVVARRQQRRPDQGRSGSSLHTRTIRSGGAWQSKARLGCVAPFDR